MTDDPTHPFPVPPAQVLEVVADAYGLTLPDLISHRQHPVWVEARRAAYQLLHEESRLSWPQIATVMNRSRSLLKGPRSRTADPAAVEILRVRLHLNGHQTSLW